jgi:DNA-binding MarR family transcriptional regulator
MKRAKAAEKGMTEDRRAGRRSARHQLVEMFWILAPAFSRWAESHMALEGLTTQRLRLLLLLVDRGPLMMSVLRHELGVTATNVTLLVDALEREHLVSRRPHPTDRRATLIQLTSKAEKCLAENCTEFKENVATLFSGFSAADQKQFLAYLEKMRDELIRRGFLDPSSLSEGGAGCAGGG